MNVYSIGEQTFRRYWWMLILRAVVTILFGIAVIIWPRISLLIFILFFGAFALVDGIIAIVASFSLRRATSNWWVVLLGGLLGIGIGLVTFFWPGLTALTLLYIVAAWAIIIGIAQLAAVFTPGPSIVSGWLLTLAGILAILLGIFLFIRPGAGILSIIWLVGIWAIAEGVLLLIRAFQSRSVTREY